MLDVDSPYGVMETTAEKLMLLLRDGGTTAKRVDLWNLLELQQNQQKCLR